MKKLIISILLLSNSYVYAANIKGECISGNCINGKGEYIYSDSSRYEGEFKNGKHNGKGIYTSLKGITYNGDWKKRW